MACVLFGRTSPAVGGLPGDVTLDVTIWHAEHFYSFFPFVCSTVSGPVFNTVCVCVRGAVTTAVSLVGIHHTHNYNFFLVMRTFKICSLSNFQLRNNSVTSRALHPWGCLVCNWRLVPLNPLHPFCPRPTFCLWQPPMCSLYL